MNQGIGRWEEKHFMVMAVSLVFTGDGVGVGVVVKAFLTSENRKSES